MNELSLYAQIPARRHAQVLSMLAGVAAMPPVAFTERHLLFRPIRQPVRLDAREAQGGSQSVMVKKRMQGEKAREELFVLKLVEKSGEGDDGDEEGVDAVTARGKENTPSLETNGDSTMVEASADPTPQEKAKGSWEIQWYDLPEPGNSASSPTNRPAEFVSVESGDPIGLVEGMGYT